MLIDSPEVQEIFESAQKMSTPQPTRQAPSRRVEALKSTISERLARPTHVLDVAADCAAVAAAVLVSYCAYYWLHIGRHAVYKLSGVAALACSVALFFALILHGNGGYTRATSLLRVRETERVISASSQLCFVSFAVSFWADIHCPRLVFLFAVILIPLVVLAEKQLIYAIGNAFYNGGYSTRRAVIYGGGLRGKRVFSVLVRSPKLGIDPVAVVDDDPALHGTVISESGYTSSRALLVLPGPVTADLLRQLRAEVVVISSPSIGPDTFAQIGTAAAEANVTLCFVPHDSVVHSGVLSYWDADGLIFASVEEPETGTLYGHLKRLFDFIVAFLLLIFLSPVLILIAAAICFTSPGPALFQQERVGKNGKRFSLYKFRTMDVSAPKYAFSPTSSNDPRITRVGAFLRRTSLDEVPQLLNVLKGDMSLVGPRPEMPFIVERYNALQRQRLCVEQGITGLWQISADRAHMIHENIQYDLYYIQNRNFFMDVAILLHTLLFAMRGI
jgi:exopolysaccharide biosynthesis polyprenyl glycosylphosphotransferase